MDSAFKRLRELIVRGRLAPGTRLVEGDLAERLARAIEALGARGSW